MHTNSKVLKNWGTDTFYVFLERERVQAEERRRVEGGRENLKQTAGYMLSTQPDVGHNPTTLES